MTTQHLTYTQLQEVFFKLREAQSNVSGANMVADRKELENRVQIVLKLMELAKGGK